jgi:dynactin 4
MIRRQMGWSDKAPIKAKPSNITPSLAEEAVNDLPDNIFTEPINLKNSK